MIKITNLNESKDLVIGEYFMFGKYQVEPIEWRKIDEHLAISEKILDCIIFNSKPNNKYKESMMRLWCNKVLGNVLKLPEDTLFVLDEEEMLSYFPTDESRQSAPTEWATMHGVHVDENGYGSYWTSSPSSCWHSGAHYVGSSGMFGAWTTDGSHIGVRPVLQII